jgi:TolA-binding protein
MTRRFPTAVFTKATLAICFWICFWCTQATSAASLADLGAYRDGCQSLSEGHYKSASEQFLETWDLLQQSGGGDLERDFVASRLLESFVRNSEASLATKWLEENPIIAPSGSTLQWAGIAFYEEERFTEAAETFGTLINSGKTEDRNITLRYLRSLALSGSAAEALAAASSMFAPISQRERAELARIAVLAENHGEALRILEDTTTPQELSFSERLTATRIKIAALVGLNRNTEAAEIACEIIDLAEDTSKSLVGFLLLESTGVDPNDTAIRTRIDGWINDSSHPATITASFFEEVLFSVGADLTQALKITASTPDHPLQHEARLRLSLEGQAFDEELPSAVEMELLAEPVRSHFIAASSAFRNKEFRTASRLFLTKAQSLKGIDRSRSAFNAALSSLQAGDLNGYKAARQKLADHNPRSPFIADLSYIGGLYLATEGDPEAFVSLQEFIRDYPKHRSNVDARLALAEIHLNQVPSRPQAAREIFEEIKSQPLTLTQNERLDYTSIWLELIDNNPAGVTQQAETFVSNWPNSSYLPEVAMLLGSQQLKGGNFGEAREKLKLIVEKFPESPYADAAEFFAAKSSHGEDATLERWQVIAGSNSPFAQQARHELGLALLARDRYEEARFEMQVLLEDTAEESALHYAVLADLGYSYYLESLSTQDKAPSLMKASEIFARLSNIKDLPVAYRYNAAVRRAKCLEALGRPNVALEIYRSMISEESIDEILGSEVSLEENEWIFRAGFSAIRILKQNNDWAGAIKIADNLSLIEGPRAIDAANLAEQLRLKHWVWE